ncbi:homing endonuclease associated repeat-containing protein [Bacillus sp. PM8313]|nr:hypothetical protein K9N56_24200 [Bacillus sp. PM8313]
MCLGEQLGRTPRSREIKQTGTIKKRFGSFNKGLEAAELTPNKRGRKTRY